MFSSAHKHTDTDGTVWLVGDGWSKRVFPLMKTKIKVASSSSVIEKSRLAREQRAEDMRQREVDRLRRLAEIKKIEEEEEIEGEVILLTAGGLR